MSHTNPLKKLEEAIINCDEEEAKKHANEISKMGIDPLEVIEKYLTPAVKVVGDRFEQGEYFLTHLLMAGEAMKASVEILTSGMSEGEREEMNKRKRKTGRIVIGTVKGDIHDIGKNIVATLLKASGFDVHDLGKDVDSVEFVKKAEEVKADIIALSALLTVTQPYQAEVISCLKETGLRDKYKVILGGGITNKEWAEEIGADGWAPDASEAVVLVKRLLQTE